MPKRNAFYAQSGGVTAVINASAAGVIETARKHKDRIGKVYAGAQRHHRRAHRGPDRHQPGVGAPPSRRCAPRPPVRSARAATSSRASTENRAAIRAADRGVPRARHRLFLLQRRQRLGRYLPQGGADLAASSATRSIAVHVPKTVDNDLPITDNCPGFGSVAKYVAASMREAAFDVASMAKTSTKVFVLEVMGRHAGWITAAVGLADDAATPIPLLMLFPEIPFDEAKFTRRASKRSVEHFGYCCVGVSEGLQECRGQAPGRGRHPRCLRPCAARRGRSGHRRAGQGAAAATSTTGRSPTTCSAPRATSPRRPTSTRRTRSARPRWSSRVQGRNAVMPAITRTSDQPYRWKISRRAARQGRERREDGAARLHQRRRLRHHRQGADATSPR